MSQDSKSLLSKSVNLSFSSIRTEYRQTNCEDRIKILLQGLLELKVNTRNLIKLYEVVDVVTDHIYARCSAIEDENLKDCFLAYMDKRVGNLHNSYLGGMIADINVTVKELEEHFNHQFDIICLFEIYVHHALEDITKFPLAEIQIKKTDNWLKERIEKIKNAFLFAKETFDIAEITDDTRTKFNMVREDVNTNLFEKFKTRLMNDMSKNHTKDAPQLYQLMTSLLDKSYIELRIKRRTISVCELKNELAQIKIDYQNALANLP
jgi:hypothetical protein